jgi:hypothetical protein
MSGSMTDVQSFVLLASMRRRNKGYVEGRGHSGIGNK